MTDHMVMVHDVEEANKLSQYLTKYSINFDVDVTLNYPLWFIITLPVKKDATFDKEFTTLNRRDEKV